MTNKFEEQFPELKVFTISPAIFWKKTHKEVLLKEDIQKHCLSKSKVFKAIDEIHIAMDMKVEHLLQIQKELLERLNLK